MCDFHLKGKCFHPERVQKGLVAIACDVHRCEYCTDKPWQEKRISEDFKYYQSLIELTATDRALEITPLTEADPASAPTQKEEPKRLFFGLF